MKGRLLYIDRLRGMTILGVVIGHFMQTNTVEGVHGKTWNMISSFKMTLFMFLCGYISHKTTSNTIFQNYRAYVLKKARTLLLPCFVWSLVVYPFFVTGLVHYDVDAILLDIINEGGNGWFLYLLFFISLIFTTFFYTSIRLNRSNKVLIDCIIGISQLLILIILSFLQIFPLIHVLIVYYAFYFVGVVVAKYDRFEKLMLDQITFSIALVIFICTIGYFKFGDTSVWNRSIKMVVSCCAIIVFYNVSRKVVFNTVIDRYLMLWGRNSIVIYLTHFTIVYKFLLPAFFLPALHPLLLLSTSAVVCVLIVMFCMGVYNIVRLSPILNLLLFGQKLERPASRNDLSSKRVSNTDQSALY